MVGRAGGWIRAARRGVEGGRKGLQAWPEEGADGVSEEGREQADV